MSTPPRFDADGIARTDGSPEALAAMLYGDSEWASRLRVADGVLIVPALLTPAGRAPLVADESAESTRAAQDVAALVAKGDPAAARAAVLARFASVRTSEGLEAFVTALGKSDATHGWVALDRLMGSEVGCLRAHALDLALERGPLTPMDLARAVDSLLDAASSDPEAVARAFESASPALRAALLLAISARHEESGAFTEHNVPTATAMLYKFFESLPEDARKRVGETLRSSVLPSAAVDALMNGRSWAARHFPNFTHRAGIATEYYAERSGENKLFVVPGVLAAAATEETIIPTLTALVTGVVGRPLALAAPRVAAGLGLAGVVSSVHTLQLDLRALSTGRDPTTNAPLNEADRWEALLRAGSAVLMIGSVIVSFPRVGPPRVVPKQQLERSDIVWLPTEQPNVTLGVPRAMLEAQAAERAVMPRPSRGPDAAARGTGASVTPPGPRGPEAGGASSAMIARPPPPALPARVPTVPATAALQLAQLARSKAHEALRNVWFATPELRAAAVESLAARIDAEAHKAYLRYLDDDLAGLAARARPGRERPLEERAMDRAKSAARKAGVEGAEALAKQEVARWSQEALETGAALELSPAAEAQRQAYLDGRVGQRIRELMPTLARSDEAGVRRIMDGLVRQGRATAREVQLDRPRQVMTVWELDDGSVVRLKPLGDLHRPGPAISGEIKLNPRLADRSLDDIAFKLSADGTPVPKWMRDANHPFQRSPHQLEAVDEMLMDEGHITLGRH
jgi:hypothetical protein